MKMNQFQAIIHKKIIRMFIANQNLRLIDKHLVLFILEIL